MSTYLQNGTDYIPNIQTFQPDYNFLGNMLQKRQGAYDANYKQLNTQYSTLLNSPMLRDDNNKTRDAFFKTINQDIKKISGMDLSLQQNVDAADKVFDSFYQNKPMVNDMVYTKKYQDNVAKHSALKNCTDPDKCGGVQAWDEGLQELQYKAEEFKNASADDAMSMQAGDYTGYFNWQKDAIKVAKDAGLSVTQDRSNGQWIVTQKNGELIEGGLYQLFKQTYGNDPRVDNNYKTKAYVNRKGHIASQVAQGISEDVAERTYLLETIKSGLKAQGLKETEFKKANDLVTARINQLQLKEQNEGLTYDESLIIKNVNNVKTNLDATQKSLDVAGNAIKNNTPDDLRSLRSSADNALSFMLQDSDLHEFAKTMSMKDAEYSIKADPYGVQSYADQLELRRMGIAHEYAKEMVSANLQKELTVTEYKHLLETGQIPGANSQATKGEALIGTGYDTATIDLDENPDFIYSQNKAEITQSAEQSKGSSAAFAWSMFNTAKQAADKNVSAANYLSNTFGKDWKTITSQTDMLNRYGKKGTATTLFETTVEALDQSKNPNIDLTWAQSAMTQGAQNINTVRMVNAAAFVTLDKNLKANKAIAKSIAGTSGVEGQAAYANMDLMVTPNGVALIGAPDSERQFAIAYQKRMGFSTENSQRAHDLYEPLKEKFLSVYNKTKGISSNQALDLSAAATGEGKVMSKPMRYAGLDAAKSGDIVLQKARTFVDIASTNPAEFKFILGNPSETNIKSQSNNDALAQFMTYFQNDLRTKTKGEDRPTFTMTEIPIAGNNANLSAVKFDAINPKYLADYIGTEKNPGLLWDIKNQLNSGITMYYDNKSVNTPTLQGLQSQIQNDAYDEVIKKKGFTYSTPYGGSIKISYDGSTNQFIMDQNTNEINTETGQITSKPQRIPMYTDQLGLTFHDVTNKALANINQSMIISMNQIAAQNKNKASQDARK